MSSSPGDTLTFPHTSAKDGAELASTTSKLITLITLPNEVIGGIIKALAKKTDISNIRLTCKILGELGARYLVEELHIMHIPKSYENLLNIAQHPLLKGYVKKVHCENVIFRRVEFEVWRSELTYFDDSNLDCGPRPVFQETVTVDKFVENLEAWTETFIAAKYSPKQLAEGWTAYQNLLAEIEDYEREGKDTKCLQALRRFPNLKKIRITNNRPTDIVQAAFSPTLFNPRSALYQGVYEPWGVVGAAEARHLESILLAISEGNVKVETFTGRWFHWAILDRWETPSFLPAFANLKHLQLTFTSNSEDLPATNDPANSVLGKLVREANRLETLFLNFVSCRASVFAMRLDGTDEPFVAPVWDDLARDKTWPNLKELELGAVDMNEDHITDFMRRHASSLKKLHLSNVFLLQGTWYSTLRSFKKALNLEIVKFSGVFGVPDEFVSFTDEVQFDPKLYLAMSGEIDGLSISLGGREYLGISLAKFMLEEADDEDPLKDWGGGLLPEGVQITFNDD